MDWLNLDYSQKETTSFALYHHDYVTLPSFRSLRTIQFQVLYSTWQHHSNVNKFQNKTLWFVFHFWSKYTEMFCWLKNSYFGVQQFNKCNKMDLRAQTLKLLQSLIYFCTDNDVVTISPIFFQIINKQTTTKTAKNSKTHFNLLCFLLSNTFPEADN